VLVKPLMKRVPPMLPDATLSVPGMLMGLLAWFAPLLIVPSFGTFCGLACGFLAQAGRRTVCGMLAEAGLARSGPHDRAHQFFSRAAGIPTTWAWRRRSWSWRCWSRLAAGDRAIGDALFRRGEKAGARRDVSRVLTIPPRHG
jgi:hypothetical protein